MQALWMRSHPCFPLLLSDSESLSPQDALCSPSAVSIDSLCPLFLLSQMSHYSGYINHWAPRTQAGDLGHYVIRQT